MRHTTILYEPGRGSKPTRVTLRMISYLVIIGGSGAIGLYAGQRSNLPPISSNLSVQAEPSTSQDVKSDSSVRPESRPTSQNNTPDVSRESPRGESGSHTSRRGMSEPAVDSTPILPEASACEELESTLDQLAREREQLALSQAQLKRAQVELNEALKLSEFQAQVTGGVTAIASVVNEPSRELHLPFLICLIDQHAASAVSVRDLVAAQGVLLGEILESTPERAGCFRVLPVTSPRFSAEVRLAQTGVRGVAVGLGDQMREEIIDPTIHLKYLERSAPALVGEVAHLVSHSGTQTEKLENNARAKRDLNMLPPLVVGEVVSAHMRENGLFQEASLTSPLRRESVKWVSVISLNKPAQ